MDSFIDLAFLNKLSERATRQPLLKLEDGTGRVAIYKDAVQAYELVPDDAPMQRQDRIVADIVSLTDLAKAEARRDPAIGAVGGLFSTAFFGQQGAVLVLREERGTKSHRILYKYTPSFALQKLEAAVGKWHSHQDFLTVLANLGPWMTGGSKPVLAAFRKISVDTTAGLVSQPHLGEDGSKGDSYVCEVRVSSNSGVTRTTIPSSILFTLPLSLRGVREYELEAMVDISGQKDDARGVFKPTFRFIVPSLESAKETAREDEIAFFAEQVKEALPDLVVARES